MFLFFLLFVCLSSVFITKKKPIRHKRSLIDAKMRKTNSCVRFRIGGEIWIQLQVSHVYLAPWIATEVKTGAVTKSFPHQERLHSALIFVELCHILWLFTE